MAIYKTKSSKTIIRKIFRDLKPDDDNWIDDSIEWIGEALEHIGAASQLCQKQCVLNVVNHKVLLPTDLYYINQVAVNNSVSPTSAKELDTLTTKVKNLQAQIVNAQAAGLEYSSTTSVLNEINSRIVLLENVYFTGNNTMQPLQYGASNFHSSMHCDDCVNENVRHEDTYIIDCDYVKTSFETGKICISYMAFPTDEDCYPLVPDDISFSEALFWYVYKKILLSRPTFKNNGINYNTAEQQWKYYCTQARNAANYPDIDRYESFMNQWVRLIPNINRHDVGFEQLNTREDLYRN
jgi:hypothetical protein|tara:strand:- start:2134 stop:3018 length:885 start_codon:yes stop_codon:yes gene_type:complete